MSALLLPVPDTAFSLDSHFSRFLIFFKIFPLPCLLELPLSKPKDWEHLTLYFLTMRNVVADLTVINTEEARFCKKKRLVTQVVCLCVCMYVVWYALICFRCLDMRFSPQVNNNDSPHHMVSEYNIVFMQPKSLIIGKYTVCSILSTKCPNTEVLCQIVPNCRH